MAVLVTLCGDCSVMCAANFGGLFGQSEFNFGFVISFIDIVTYILSKLNGLLTVTISIYY